MIKTERERAIKSEKTWEICNKKRDRKVRKTGIKELHVEREREKRKKIIR